jgi:hypothetical protein
VLDDVSPRYMKSAAALQACDVNLGIALRSLLDCGDSDPCDQAPRHTHPDGRFRHRRLIAVPPAGLSIRQDQYRTELFRWNPGIGF